MHDVRGREDLLDEPGAGGGDDPGARHRPSLAHWAGFCLSAVRRRPVLTTLVFLAFMGLCTTYYLVKTPVYRVEARILAQRQQAMPGIVRPSSSEDAPTRSAYDLVHRRENLLTLLKQAGVLARLVNAPATPGQLDALQRLLPGSEAAGDRDPVDELVLLLDKDLVINSTEGSINLSIDWPNAAEAFKLIEAAVQNFLEARHVQEITARDEAISLLQGRVATLRERLDRSIEETRRQVPRRYEVALDSRPTGASAGIPATEELVKVKSLIDAKERAIGDVEEFRRRRLADLQAQLDAQRGVLSDAHPTIQNLRQDIAALSLESPQVAGLREEQRRLREEYAARLALEQGKAVPSPGPVYRLAPPQAQSNEESEQVRQARFEYQQMVDRTNAALLDLDNARVGFKYRYEVVWPAQVPKKPVSPNPFKVFGLGFVGALGLAVLAAAWSALRSGRILVDWQVERTLDLPILGRIGR